MKTMTRTQMAEKAGVDPRTLRNWITLHMDELIPLGMPPGKGTIPIIVAKYIIENYGIDI